jgi:hypothetical protein
MHWGAASGPERLDFPLHEWAATQQASLLGQLLHPAVLARVRDAELRAEPGEATLGLPELFETLTGAIWSEIGAGTSGRPARPRNIGSVRRDLQRLYLDALVRLAVSPSPETPDDAGAMARAMLVELGADIDRLLAAPHPDLDPYTRAHLADARDRIGRALDTRIVQTTTFSTKRGMLYILLSSEPSPLAQTAVYMAGMLAGYLLLTEPHEWERVRETVREALKRRKV